MTKEKSLSEEIVERDPAARRASDYSDAWRWGACDALGKAIRVALRLGHPEVAIEIATLGLDLFGSAFETELRLRQYETIAGRVLVGRDT